MKQILPAIFTSVWKRKETKIYLLFVLFPVIFLLASFFGKSNFMQISVIGDNRVSGIAFLDMMISSADSFILPTLAIYFLTISVFRREIDDHTMFLYRDLSRKNIFFSKYLSLLSILVLFYILFTCVSTTIYFTRVVQFPFASNTFFDNDLSITLSTLEDIFGIFLKDIFSVTVASVLCLYLKTGSTIVVAIILTFASMMTSMIGGGIAMLFPNGYNRLLNDDILSTPQAFLGALGITLVYAFILLIIGSKKFQNLEF